MKVWQWRSSPLDQRTGSAIFAQLFLDEPIATLLESPYPPSPDYPQLAQYSICAGSPRLIDGILQQWTPPVGEVLDMLKSRLESPFAPENSPAHLPLHLPFTGGWLGWLGYDVAAEIENLPSTNPDPIGLPVAFWYEPECFAVLDHEAQILWLAASDDQQLDALDDRLNSDRLNDDRLNSARPLNPSSNACHHEVEFHTNRSDYIAAILKAKEHIQAGDIFQANLSLRFSTQTNVNSWEIYQALQAINPSPFASYWHTPWGDVVSCSPERLVEAHWQDNQLQVSSRPIAGTRKRGQNLEQDQQLAIELRHNIKEQAEHIMLVDLERNDLGRVCEWGSVVVDELLAIEHYSHVMHLVSNVVGVLKPTYDSVDLIRALFPGGTITGCPKVRCMQIIAALEPVGRSLFYGSCGYLDRRGNLDLNILIRTLIYRPLIYRPLIYRHDGNIATIWGQVGAGIVADSDPDREWLEALQKAEAALQAFRSVT